MLNMSETKVIVNTKMATPNGLGVDWIANNIYWTDNEYKVGINKICFRGIRIPKVMVPLILLANFYRCLKLPA